MPSKELINEVSYRMAIADAYGESPIPDPSRFRRHAEAAISTIRAALLEDRYLHEIIESYFNMPHGRGYGKDRLSVFLAASALGEQSE
ncbi:hypothetical protein [Brucella anthropi]|uniref:hypothetical protein n=1 Tax=Brucella anthropi TaxID=529 RepID=UPI000CFE275E|nr:hypothetical protein [Ochrobactrum sp. MYb49]PQZ63067.1 hypothetical protein CQ057_16745 [Ochrobactrum sp. MYb49]